MTSTSELHKIVKITKKKKGKLGQKKETKADLQRKDDIETLWREGIISWKLDSNQRELYYLFHKRDMENNPEELNKIIGLYSRQAGKSYGLGIIAIEQCLQNDGISICYVAPTVKMANGIVRKNFIQILKDCPEDLQPKFNSQTNEYTFPNNSVIKIYGTDNKAAEGIRGNSFDKIIVDEAGFIDKEDFDYIVESILQPTLTNAPEPVIFFISTPPKKADHPFNKMIDMSEVDGKLLVRTIYDCPRLSPARIASIAKSQGGEQSESFQREYLCRRVRSSESSVIPEATEDNLKIIEQEHKRPPFFTTYVSADWGVKDWTAILFGYYDFRNGIVVVEDELIFNAANSTTKEIAEQIRTKERLLWGKEGAEFYKEPDLRVCDNDLQIIIDLNRLHQLSFIPTRKDNRDAAINEVRIMFAAHKIRIHPRCKTLRNHIRLASWNKSMKDFDRAPDGSHYDTIAALIYFIRNVMYHKNPYPDMYDYRGMELSPKFRPESKDINSGIHQLKNLLAVKKLR